MCSATETPTLEQENIAVVTRAFEAYARSDFAAVEAAFAEDANWSTVAAGVLPGPLHKKRGAVLAYLRLIHQETQGTAVATPVAVAAAEQRVFVELSLRAQRKGRVLEASLVSVFWVVDGLIANVQQHFADFPAYEAFFR